MARIREFTQDHLSSSPHPTEVECGWQIVTDASGARLLQLNTYGSDQRQSAKKVSQTIQLDRRSAIELISILKSTFGL